MKRKQGSGSVQMLGPTKAFLRWPEMGRRASRVVHNVTEAEAHQVMDAIIERLQERGTNHTVATYTEAWLDEECPRRHDESSVRSRARCYILADPIGSKLICELRPRHVKAWIKRLRKTRLKQQSVRHCVNLLSAICRGAVEDELLPSNPVHAVSKPPVPKSARREIIATAAQLERLAYDETLDQEAATIAVLLAGHCLRSGELRGLHIGDDHGDHLRVWRSGPHADDTKANGFRRVASFGLGQFALRKWRKLRPVLQVKRCNIETSPYLVPVPKGWFRARGRVGRLLVEVCGEGFKTHDLRGTGATHLLSGTFGDPWEVADVASYIGDSIDTTQRAYAHVIPTRHEELGKGQRIRSGYDASDAELISSVISLRARQDSNLRPLASEAHGYPLSSRADGSSGIPSISRLARVFLEAVRDDDEFAIERGIELAIEGLKAQRSKGRAAS